MHAFISFLNKSLQINGRMHLSKVDFSSAAASRNRLYKTIQYPLKND